MGEGSHLARKGLWAPLVVSRCKNLEHAEGDNIIDRVRKIGCAGMLKGLEELLKPGPENRATEPRSRVWDFKLHGTLEEAELRGEEAKLRVQDQVGSKIFTMYVCMCVCMHVLYIHRAFDAQMA